MIRSTRPRALSMLFAIALLGAAACGDDAPADASPTDTGGDDAIDDAGSAEDTSAETDTAVDGGIDDDASTIDAGDTAAEDTAADAPPLPDAFSMTAEDFRCITDYEAVRGFFISNELGRLDEAIAAAEADFAVDVPPGTVIQLIPQEAMVKGLPGSSPATDDWEFFILNPTADGTVITDRGFTEISNVAGTCWGCHVGASDRDGVCEQTGLCADAALPRNIVDTLVESDQRCAD